MAVSYYIMEIELNLLKRLELLTEQSEHELNIQIQNTIANVMIKYYDIIKQSAFIDLLKRILSFQK